MNALNNEEVGKYLNEYFVASFQKVGTFKIVGRQKQGGNVAAYFCAPDGRVLHCVAGPVNAATMLREAQWVVETTRAAMKEAKGDGAKFKAFFRKAHADKLRSEFGVVVEPVTYDPPTEQDPNSALTYNDPSGRPLAPKLPPPPIDGPDVTLRAKELQAAARAAPGNFALDARKGGRVWLNNQGRVHQLMAAHAMARIETVYGAVFEGILGERISTKPVEVVTPFPWVRK
ncbi:MAG TPA: hypothetical protein VFA26_26335 [Gemmataceae bacterium]|nr:hypothetical protein [Gemmataceae bacterium]